MNALEANSTTASAPRFPRRAAPSRSRPACAGCAWRCRSRSTTSTSGCCATGADRRPRQGWSIVDCGIDNAATRAAWEQVFATALDGLPVLRVIVTHMHPDHIGCAHWLCERWNARLWISATDFGIARAWRARAAPASAGRSRRRSWRCTAWPPIRMRSASVAARTNYYRSLVPAGAGAVPAPARRRHVASAAAQRARLDTATSATATRPSTWRCTAQRARVLISGDMVLPRISTNVSVVDVEPEADPLHALPRLDRAHARDRRRRPRACRRTACRSRGCTRASTSCRRTTPSASPKRSRRAPRRRRARSSSCRCSSSARSTCTR